MPRLKPPLTPHQLLREGLRIFHYYHHHLPYEYQAAGLPISTPPLPTREIKYVSFLIPKAALLQELDTITSTYIAPAMITLSTLIPPTAHFLSIHDGDASDSLHNIYMSITVADDWATTPTPNLCVTYSVLVQPQEQTDVLQ